MRYLAGPRQLLDRLFLFLYIPVGRPYSALALVYFVSKDILGDL